MSGKIHLIEAFDVVVPLPKPFTLGKINISRREYVMVRVYDDEGNYGTSVGLKRSAPIAETVYQTIVPHLHGRELAEYDSLYNLVKKTNAPLGTNGIFMRALSLVDCATYDLLAKRSNMPLYEYLGGSYRELPYVLVGGYPIPEETKETLQKQAIEMNELKAAVIKIGSCGNLAKDTERLQQMREVLPDGPPLAIDFYWQFNTHKELLPEAQKWENLQMAWLEDPFEFDNHSAVKALSGLLPYPVAVGDEQAGEESLLHLMDECKIKVLRLDATVCGGVKAFLKMADYAHQRNIPVVSHLFHHLHVQLACATLGVKYVEIFNPASNLDSLHLLWTTDDSLKGKLSPEHYPSGVYPWDEDKIAYYKKNTHASFVK